MKNQQTTSLGAFSLSLTVKDLDKSLQFYEKLGFSQVGGDAKENWVILRNGIATIGLFHDMFPENIMTFNPGWDSQGADLDSFTDVRDIQRQFKSLSIDLVSEADESSNGPASLMLTDPDGNQILIDQHR